MLISVLDYCAQYCEMLDKLYTPVENNRTINEFAWFGYFIRMIIYRIKLSQYKKEYLAWARANGISLSYQAHGIGV